jgi:hypothetical protein
VGLALLDPPYGNGNALLFLDVNKSNIGKQCLRSESGSDTP